MAVHLEDWDIIGWLIKETIEVKSNDFTIDLWGLAHGKVEWVVLAEGSYLPGGGSFLGDLVVEGLDFLINETRDFADLAVDNFLDGPMVP